MSENIDYQPRIFTVSTLTILHYNRPTNRQIQFVLRILGGSFTMDELTRRAEKANCVIGDSTRDEWETQQFLIFKRLKSNDPHHFSEEEFQKYIIARFSTI